MNLLSQLSKFDNFMIDLLLASKLVDGFGCLEILRIYLSVNVIGIGFRVNDYERKQF